MTSPISWLLAATAHGPMIVNRHDAVTVESGATFGVGHQLLSTGTYDAEDLELQKNVLNLLRHYRAPNGEREIVYLDGGANIGAFTIPIARHMRGWGRVVAVEPQDQVFYALCGSVVLNNLDNVECINALLAHAYDHSIKVPVVDYTQPTSFGSLPSRTYLPNDSGQAFSDQTRWAQSVPIEVCGNHLDLLKLDLEGMELECLSGHAIYVREKQPVMCIEHLKTNLTALQHLLELWSYVCFVDTKDVWAAHRDDPMLKHFTMKGGDNKAQGS